jgi:hypothetical protein
VDAAAAAGREDGVLTLDPADGGPIVGYFCLLEDPDGNQVEFSYGQPINPRDLPGSRATAPAAPEPSGAGRTGSGVDLHRR